MNCLKAVAKVAPRPGRAVLRAEVRLRLVRRERLSREAGRQHAPPRDPVAPLAAGLARRGPRREPRRAERAARARRSRTSPRRTSKRPPEAGDAEAIALDLDGDFDAVLGHDRYDCVLVLDVLEHLKRPEEGVRKIARDPEARRNALREHGQHRVPRHAPEPLPRPVQLRQARHPRPHAHAPVHDLLVPQAARRTAAS